MKQSALHYFRQLNLTPIVKSIVILDIDGTLLSDGDETVGVEEVAAVKRLVEQDNQVYLVSNGFSHKKSRNKSIASELGVTFYETEYKKPLKLSVAPLVIGTSKQVIIIGDKFLTDGLLAVNLEVPFIRVRSIRSNKDSLYVKLAYHLDDLVSNFASSLARPPYYYQKLINKESVGIITILTEPPKQLRKIWEFLQRELKRQLKQLIFLTTRNSRYQNTGGPEAVINSLLAGFEDLNVPHFYNPWQHQVTPVVGVVRGVTTLRWALDQKSKGFVRTIVAGPNIVVIPPDEHNLMSDPRIDRVVVPSQWNKEWWMSFDQAFDSKAVTWPAGVSDNGSNRNPEGVCIVYSKNADEKLFHKIMEVLWTHKLPIVVSQYGKFKQHEYFRLLKQAKMMVYLSESESQGIALHEAWMADIPTLVWNRGYLGYQNYRFDHPAIAAPYMTPECGLQFKDDGDFEQKLIEFLEKYEGFKPRAYSLAHFTNKITTRKYIDIVYEVDQQSS